MTTRITAGAALALAMSAAAQAQDTFYWPAPVISGQPMHMAAFPPGMPLALITRTEVNSKQARPGDRVYLEVAESLSSRGQIVVPVGAPAVAEVVRSEKNGHFGKKGLVELRLLYVQTPSGPVRLDGSVGDKGKDAALWSVGGMVLTGGWAWALIHGTSGYIRHGTPVMAYLAEPLRFLPQPAAVESADVTVQPDNLRPLPARFDPSVFGGDIPRTYTRH